jgi:hypothetical protein
MYSMLRNSASGPEIGLPGRILAGLLPGNHPHRPAVVKDSLYFVFGCAKQVPALLSKVGRDLFQPPMEVRSLCPAVFKDVFYCFLVTPPPGGVPREGPDCRFPSEAVVLGRIRGPINVFMFILTLSTAGYDMAPDPSTMVGRLGLRTLDRFESLQHGLTEIYRTFFSQLYSRTVLILSLIPPSSGGSRGRARAVIFLRGSVVLGRFRPGSGGNSYGF